jgi:hypothetical protein
MPTTNPLFGASDLSSWLRQPVTDDAADVVERVVWGWLKPLLASQGVTERPTDPSDELKAWAIELGAIAYANPEGLDAYSLESESSKYSSDRRDQLLELAASGGTATPGVALAPKGSFPSARPYPDPAERCW